MRIFGAMKRHTTVTLVRHGETTLNVKGVIQGHTDAVLSEHGINQAEALGKHISHEKFTRAYASDLIRAKHTADLILKHSKCHVDISIEKRLRERNYGKAEGKYFAQYFEEAKRAGQKPTEYTPEGGETIPQLTTRIEEFFTELLKLVDQQESENTENILVVTHGGLLRVFMIYLSSSTDNYILENFDKAVALNLSPNTGVTRMHIHPLNDERQRLIQFHTIHDATHLNTIKSH